jgi:hypothetical protein
MLRRRFALLAASLSLAACGSTPSNPQFQNATHELATASDLYRGGPQQARPPDARLEAGTLVRTIESAGSYTLIELASGDGGYVLTAALRPLGER